MVPQKRAKDRFVVNSLSHHAQLSVCLVGFQSQVAPYQRAQWSRGSVVAHPRPVLLHAQCRHSGLAQVSVWYLWVRRSLRTGVPHTSQGVSMCSFRVCRVAAL